MYVPEENFSDLQKLAMSSTAMPKLRKITPEHRLFSLSLAFAAAGTCSGKVKKKYIYIGHFDVLKSTLVFW